MPDHAPMIIDDKYPEILADIARTVHQSLLGTPGLNISYQQACEIAFAAAEHVRTNIGGISNYVPKGVSYMASVRDREMYAKFNGTNYDVLALEYNLSSVRVRTIVDAMTEQERKNRQNPLF